MATRHRIPFTWTSGQSLSAWTQMPAGARVTGIELPSGMTGSRVVFVGAESDGGTALTLYDIEANTVSAAIPSGGGRIVFWPGAVGNQNWMALRSVDAAGAAINQAAGRSAAWLIEVE